MLKWRGQNIEQKERRYGTIEEKRNIEGIGSVRERVKYKRWKGCKYYKNNAFTMLLTLLLANVYIITYLLLLV